MKSVNILWLLLDSLFLIVFNVLFFMFIYVENMKDAVWVSYGFIHFAYFLLLATPLLVRSSQADYIYRRPLYAISSVFFLIELVVGTILILKMPDNISLTIIVQVILVALFIAFLLAHLIANEHTANAVNRREMELHYVKESASRIKSILKRSTDKSTSKNIQMLYDFIHSSPIRSASEVYSIEKDIINEIENLDRAMNQNASEQINVITTRIYQMAERRNSKLHLLHK